MGGGGPRVYLELLGGGQAVKADYDATWSDQTDPAGVPGAGSAPETNTKEWKFHAAQLTYNATTGQWASKVWAEQNDLFVRLLNFAKVEPPPLYICLWGLGE